MKIPKCSLWFLIGWFLPFLILIMQWKSDGCFFCSILTTKIERISISWDISRVSAFVRQLVEQQSAFIVCRCENQIDRWRNNWEWEKENTLTQKVSETVAIDWRLQLERGKERDRESIALSDRVRCRIHTTVDRIYVCVYVLWLFFFVF